MQRLCARILPGSTDVWLAGLVPDRVRGEAEEPRGGIWIDGSCEALESSQCVERFQPRGLDEHRQWRSCIELPDEPGCPHPLGVWPDAAGVGSCDEVGDGVRVGRAASRSEGECVRGVTGVGEEPGELAQHRDASPAPAGDRDIHVGTKTVEVLVPDGDDLLRGEPGAEAEADQHVGVLPAVRSGLRARPAHHRYDLAAVVRDGRVACWHWWQSVGRCLGEVFGHAQQEGAPVSSSRGSELPAADLRVVRDDAAFEQTRNVQRQACGLPSPEAELRCRAVQVEHAVGNVPFAPKHDRAYEVANRLPVGRLDFRLVGMRIPFCSGHVPIVISKGRWARHTSACRRLVLSAVRQTGVMAYRATPRDELSEAARRRASDFGPGLRRLGWRGATAAIARSIGLPAKTLGRIERGEQLPTYEQALLIAEAIGRPLEDISGPLRARSVRQRTYRRIVAEYGEWNLVDVDALSPGPMELSLLPGAGERGSRHDGVEWLYVSRGSVQVDFGYRDDAVRLEEREFYSFDASAPHALSNVGECDAVVLRGMSVLGLQLHTEELRQEDRFEPKGNPSRL